MEHKINEPIVILDSKQYRYYKEREKKANITNAQICQEAIKLFKDWTKKTNFKVKIRMLTLRGTFIGSKETSFFCEYDRNKIVAEKDFRDISFMFEQSLNQSVNKFISEAYKEHRQELENEFNARFSKRQKSYNKMKKLFVCSAFTAAVLLIVVIVMIIKMV